MEEKKKKNLKNVFIYLSLIILIAFTIITSIALNYKKNQLDELKEKNDEMNSVLDKEVSNALLQDFEIFSKNIDIFIDKL